MRIWVVVPAFNEERHITGLIQDIKAKGLPLLIVDDGSTDSTGVIAKDSGADIVLRNNVKSGKGSALKRAIKYVLNSLPDCEAVIIMDADRQHSISDLDLFIESLLSGHKFIIGNRMLDQGNMPLVRRMTNRAMSVFISKLCSQDIPDTQCGFKAISRDVLEAMDIYSNNYEIDSELIIKSARLGYKIYSVPVQSIYRNQKSNINPVIDTFRFLRFVFLRDK